MEPEMKKHFILLNQSTIMNLSTHAPASFADPTWITEFIVKMGESEFWAYKKSVYDFLDKLKVHQSLSVEAWVEPVNYDLFIKIASCFISESNYCFKINPEYTIIKRNFNAQELERSLALLRSKRRSQEIAGDGRGTGSESGGTPIVPTPESSIQSLLKG